MKHPWVNILILAFVTVEFISGFWGLVSGSRDEAVFIIIHRIAGYGLVVLMVWKVAIILFALRNRKRGRMERTASLVLFGLLMVTLGPRIRMVCRRAVLLPSTLRHHLERR